MNGIARLSLTGLLMVGSRLRRASGREQEGPSAGAGKPEAEETVFDDMIQTQDRARAVEGVLMDSKRDLDTAIQHAEDDAAE